MNDRFCASLLGLEFSGKKSLATEIKEKFEVNVILIEELIQKRLQEYQMLKEKGVEISPETEEIVEKCYEGKDLPNRLIISLLQ